LSLNVKPPVPLTKYTIIVYLRRNAVQFTKTAFNILGVPYSRHAFIAAKK
jgi:hypothetical protein